MLTNLNKHSLSLRKNVKLITLLKVQFVMRVQLSVFLSTNISTASSFLSILIKI